MTSGSFRIVSDTLVQRLDDFTSVYSVYVKCTAGPTSGVRHAYKSSAVGSELGLQYMLSQTICYGHSIIPLGGSSVVS